MHIVSILFYWTVLSSQSDISSNRPYIFTVYKLRTAPAILRKAQLAVWTVLYRQCCLALASRGAAYIAQGLLLHLSINF